LLYTIGFTKSTAEHFFTRLIDNHIDVLLDIRRNNTSQLASFAKVPDIQYFLRKIAGICYIHDIDLSPSEEILDAYRKKQIDWTTYVRAFEEWMDARGAEAIISSRYGDATSKNYCLLCSEAEPTHCHRRLVADRFERVLGVQITHL